MEMWFTEPASPGQTLSLKVRRVLHQSRSPFQEIALLETEDFGNALILDGLVQTTERDEYIYHEALAHVPMACHPAPRRVLVVGGGDGGTVREVLRHPVESVDLCEIDGEVIAQARLHLPGIAAGLGDPRVRIFVRDAIEFIAQARARYDVILVDCSDPVGPGEGLYTAEFYRSVQAALRPGGIVAVQTESPFAMPEAMERVYRALYAVFERIDPYVGTVPTYPGALWSWALCRDTDAPPSIARPSDLPALEAVTRYYNAEIHAAGFALPNELRRTLARLSASMTRMAG